MQHHFFVSLLISTLLALPGCAASEAELSSLREELISTTDELTTTLSKIHDEKSLQTSIPKIRSSADILMGIKEKLGNTRVRGSTDRNLQAKYERRLEEVSQRLDSQLVRLRTIPGASASLTPIFAQLAER